MNEHEDGLAIDARLIAEGIRKNQKSGTCVIYRPLILTLEQAREDGKYEPPETFMGQFPGGNGDILDRDGIIKDAQRQTALLCRLWHEIYKAASEGKNQIGLDEMMEWGRAFAVQYADFQTALESQKNYITYYLPALRQIEEMKAELEKGKDSPNKAEITSRLGNLESLLQTLGGKVDAIGARQQEDRAAESEEHAGMVKEIRHERKQHERRYLVTQDLAAATIRRIAIAIGYKYYSTCTVRTIQNWESANPKHKIPAWYPGRNCELATFEKRVRSGLQVEQITKIHRETIRNIKNPIHYSSDDELDEMTHPTDYKRPHRKTDDMK